jgi:hypothetical protein
MGGVATDRSEEFSRYAQALPPGKQEGQDASAEAHEDNGAQTGVEALR